MAVQQTNRVSIGNPEGNLSGCHSHGGNLRLARETYGFDETEFLDFSSNINPMGPPPGVRRYLRTRWREVMHYPDPQSKELRRALGVYYGVAPDQVLPGNGATELIYLIMRWLRPCRIMIPAPTFGEYARAARVCGAEVVLFHLPEARGFRLNPAELCSSLAKVDLLFLCNPNNPVGNLVPRSALAEILAYCQRQGTFVVIDESFLDFLPEEKQLTVIGEAVHSANILVLRSLTKIFALPGLRLGCGIAHAATINALRDCQDAWSVNRLAQQAGVLALADEGFLQLTRRWLQREKKFLFRQLSSLEGLRPYCPEANFILTDVAGSGFSSTELAHLLGRQQILIRDCRSFPALDGRCVRVAVKNRAANVRLIGSLRRVLEKRGNDQV